jgi:hypothetical protein
MGLTRCSLYCKLDFMKDHTAEPFSPGQRAAAYWFIDGLPLIVPGVEFVIWGLLGIAGVFLPGMRLAGGQFGFMIVFFGAVLGFDHFVTEFFKARVTYPRTGFARRPIGQEEKWFMRMFSRPLEPFGEPMDHTLKLQERPVQDENFTPFNRWTLLILFCAVVVAAAADDGDLGFITGKPWSLPAILAATAISVYLPNRDTEPRYRWWLLLLLPLAGLAVVPLQLPIRLRPQLVPLVAGLWLIAEGGLSFLGYLRKFPRPVARKEAYP